MKKYRCIKKTNINFINVGDVIYAEKRYITNNIYGCNVSTCYYLHYNDHIIGRMDESDFFRYFEPYIEEQEECTVTKLDDQQPTKNTYKGWQIIKMISEGEIKEGTIIENIEEEYTFTYEKGSYFMDLNDLTKGEFKISKPVELITFKEALERKVNVRHKDWKIESTTPQNVLNHYTKIENTEILQDLFSDAKVWEVES